MRKVIRAGLILFGTIAFGPVAYAADANNGENQYDISDRLSGPRIYVGLGADNVGERENFDAYIYGTVELASRVYEETSGLRFRASVDVSGIGLWGGAGLSFEHVFDDPYYVEASFLAGAYTDFGDFDLQHGLEFRSQIAVGYHFDNGYDVAIAYSHKSNAGIGNDNPGAEALYLRVGRGF